MRARATVRVALLLSCSALVLPAAMTAPSEVSSGHRSPPALHYLLERAQFMKEESERFLGNRLVLSAEEQRVNAVLMAWKEAEYLVPEAKFLPAHSFFKVRARVEASPVFKFIRKMPKGEPAARGLVTREVPVHFAHEIEQNP